MPDKVSVIIPTYNRLSFLLNAIESVKKQTYKNIEIIVGNDCSTDPEYYSHDFGEKVRVIHQKENSKKLFGYACAGYVRNVGIKECTGRYVAFLDDDDSWFPIKIELQMKAIQQTDCKMSCTDAYIGSGAYNATKQYPKFNAEQAFNYICRVYQSKGSTLMDNGFPKLWNHAFLKINNCCICSSVIVKKTILEKIDYMNHYKNGEEDYDCWLRVLQHTNCVYLDEPCVYYDSGHGYGQNY